MSRELIHHTYIAFYQRPADPAGMIYWLDQYNANGGDIGAISAISAAFANASESQALYGSLPLSDKINSLYISAFERAASSEEIAYWEASGFNFVEISIATLNGAQGDDLATLSKKVEYADHFVSILDPQGSGIGPFAYDYVDPSLGRALMDLVTMNSDVSYENVLAQVHLAFAGGAITPLALSEVYERITIMS